MNYRREIDGLRAVAVLPVILFHAGFEWFGGGFVGVDVFFVISGYLITSIILFEKRDGTFSLLRFYERRARRILPALFLVMLATVPFAWLWMVPSDAVDFSESLVAVPLFASNILFWREAGYFATANELKPLLHTWSLAVEEQYYVLFPVFLLLAWRLGKRWIVGILVVAAIVSLGAAQWASINKPAAAFYLLPTRGWELLIGAFVAFYLFDKGGKEAAANTTGQAAGLAGVLLIVYAVFTFNKSTPFPGVYALIPTLGTVLVILFATPQTWVGKLLGSKVLVGMGLISYSAYLWHQPLFAFSRMRSMDPPDTFLLLFLALASIFLAFLSWKFVELGFRNKDKVSRRTIFSLAVSASLFMALLGWLGQSRNGFENRFALPDEMAKTLVLPDRAHACFDKPGANTRDDWLCDVGAKGHKPSFVVFGDSHAVALLPAFDAAATKNDISGLTVSASGCTPFLGIYAIPGDRREKACHLLNQRVYDYVSNNKIKQVFLVARWTYYTDGGYDGANFSYIGLNENGKTDKEESRKAFEKGLEKTVDEYARAGAQLVVVAQVPQQNYNARNVYYKVYGGEAENPTENLRKLSVPLEEHQRLQTFVEKLFKKYHQVQLLNFVTLNDIYCDKSRCPIGTARQSYYFDNDHLSAFGASRAADAIAEQLRN